MLDAVLLLLPESPPPVPPRAPRPGSPSTSHGLGLDIDPTALVSRLCRCARPTSIEIAAALASEPARAGARRAHRGARCRRRPAGCSSQIGDLLAKDVAIVYITHRIPEVIEIADRADACCATARVVGRGQVSDFTADQIVELIIGRSLETTFPDKADPDV